MDEKTVPEVVLKRADELVVGDSVAERCLPYRFNRGPAVVVFKVDEPSNGTILDGGAHTFFAYRYPNGVHDGTTVRAEAELLVYPRPDEDPQPAAGRTPPHFGAVVDVGGHTAVAGGLIEIDPPKVFACTAHGVHPHPGSGGGFMVCLDCPECRPPGASAD